MDEAISKIYYSDKEGGFSSLNRLYAAVKRDNPAIKMNDVKNFLQKQEAYEIFYQAKPQKSPARSFITSEPGQLLCKSQMREKKFFFFLLFHVLWRI